MLHNLQKLFSQAYILGGSPCSGKSTVAEKLCAVYGFPSYKVDDHDQEHFHRCLPEQQPVMFKYAHMGWNDIWAQSTSQLVADELSYYRERFQFILEDLWQFNPETYLLLEGAAFLPELIDRYPVNQNNVVFMVPTMEFQVQHYRQRPWIRQILKECLDPDQAFENWMKRDALFGQEIIHQANACGFSTISVDGVSDIDEQFNDIRSRFGLETIQTVKK